MLILVFRSYHSNYTFPDIKPPVQFGLEHTECLVIADTIAPENDTAFLFITVHHGTGVNSFVMRLGG